MEQRPARPNVALNILLVLASTLFVLVAIELAARFYLEHIADEPRFLSFASYRQLQERYGNKADTGASLKQLYSPHRYLGYYPTPDYRWGENRHNALGFRGEEIELPKPAGQFRIVCLGGSTTYTSDLEDYRLSYPSVLERELRERGHTNVRVINAGAAGWTSWESLINFELRVLDLEPDLIIVYHGINDIHARLVWPPPAYRGDNSGRRVPNQSGLFMPSILEYSTLARVLMIRAGWIRSHADLARTIDRAPSTYYGDLFRQQVIDGSYPDGIFRTVPATKMLEVNGPTFYERNLTSIVALADRYRVRSVLASFAYSPEFKEEPRVASKEYRDAFVEMNATVARVAARSSAEYFDFAGAFPSSKRYFSDGRHVNEEGVRLKAKLFADFLESDRLLAGGGP